MPASLILRGLWRVFRLFALAFLVVLLMLMFLENWLVFQPRSEPRSTWTPPTAHGEQVEFTAEDGTRLSGWYLPHPQSRGVAIYAGGNAGNMSFWADELQTLNEELRLSILGFDYRGYGRSQGSPSEKGVLADARAARRWLAARAQVPEERVVLMGRSLGGGVAVDLAQDGCRALVLERTFTSLPDVAARIYPFLPVRYFMRTRFNSLKKIANYHGPLLISHGDADELTPVEMGRTLYDAAPSRAKSFFLIPDGDHLCPQPESYYQELARFLDAAP